MPILYYYNSFREALHCMLVADDVEPSSNLCSKISTDVRMSSLSSFTLYDLCFVLLHRIIESIAFTSMPDSLMTELMEFTSLTMSIYLS
jgi:hypothetical protein